MNDTRNAAEVLRAIAAFVEQGLPAPTSVTLYLSTPEVLVDPRHLAAWIDALGLPEPSWRLAATATPDRPWSHPTWLDSETAGLPFVLSAVRYDAEAVAS